jgi:hypothetical protein
MNVHGIQVMVTIALVGIAGAVAGGCADGGEAARQMARVNLAQTVGYEKQIEEKIAAEQSYYEKALKSISQRARESGEDEPSLALNTLATKYQTKFSDKNAPATEADLREFADQAIAAVAEVRSALDQQQEAFKEQSYLNVNALSLDKENLKKVKKALEQLQAEPTDSSRIANWVAFIRETKKELDKLEEAATDPAQPE